MKFLASCFYEHGQYTVAEWLIDDTEKAHLQNIHAISRDEFLRYIKEHDIKVVTINDFLFGVILVNDEIYFDMIEQED
jgi:hypothetical protein